MPIKENEILDQVEAYVAGHIRLSDFSAWLYEIAWDIELDTPVPAQAFAYAVLGRVAERSTSGSSDEALRAELQRLARARREGLDRLSRVIERRMAADPVRTESSSQVVEVPAVLPVPVEP